MVRLDAKTKTRIKTILSIVGVIVLVFGCIKIAAWLGNTF